LIEGSKGGHCRVQSGVFWASELVAVKERSIASAHRVFFGPREAVVEGNTDRGAGAKAALSILDEKRCQGLGYVVPHGRALLSGLTTRAREKARKEVGDEAPLEETRQTAPRFWLRGNCARSCEAES